MQPFFITGLPRSRTAWMAEFMGAVHEPTADIKSIEDMRGVFERHSGVSDSGLGFWIEWILREIKPLTVIIERDIDDVEKSLDKLNIPKTNYCELLKDRLMYFRNHPLVMTVPFERLNDIRVMQKVWWHLKTGAPFDEGRFREMKDINIQCDHEKTKESAKHATIYQEIEPFIRPKELENA